MPTERSTLSRSAIVFLVLLILALVAFSLATAQLFQRGQWGPAIGILAEEALVVYALVSAIVRFNRRLRVIRPKNARLAHHYSHLYIWCKDPLHCRRCQGWWFGFSGFFVVALTISAGAVSPVLIPLMVGLPAAVGAGTAFLALTPVHGAIGRLYRLSKTHWMENPIITATMGFLFAVGILCISESVVLVLRS